MQHSSQLYQSFDSILLLSHGHALYSGPGLFAPSDYFTTAASAVVPAYPPGYNVADYLLEVASDPHVSLFQLQQKHVTAANTQKPTDSVIEVSEKEHHLISSEERLNHAPGSPFNNSTKVWSASRTRSRYATTFLTQLQILSGREWKILRR